MHGDSAIKVDHVSKKYCKSLKKSMIYGVTDIARNTFGLSSRSEKLRKNEFWAVNDISFKVKKGECLGIIGSNGSGKSTLLKMLNGIFWPDVGEIQVKGKVGALISVGAGFHPLLTGLENIYLNSAILGMDKNEVEKKLDDIIDFSEISDFINTPVKYYSSGMFVRLGFSVAIHCNQNVLLIDEILSVGDESFREKSYKKMMELLNTGCSVVFVSHNLRSIETICDKVIWLDKGRIKFYGDSTEGVETYLNYVEQRRKSDHTNIFTRPDNETPIWIKNVETINSQKIVTATYRFGEKIIIQIQYESLKEVKNPYFHIGIRKKGKDQVLTSFNMFLKDVHFIAKEGIGTVECKIDKLNFSPGNYEILAGIQKNISGALGSKHYQKHFKVNEIVIQGNSKELNLPGLPNSLLYSMSPVLIDHEWSINN